MRGAAQLSAVGPAGPQTALHLNRGLAAPRQLERIHNNFAILQRETTSLREGRAERAAASSLSLPHFPLRPTPCPLPTTARYEDEWKLNRCTGALLALLAQPAPLPAPHSGENEIIRSFTEFSRRSLPCDCKQCRKMLTKLFRLFRLNFDRQ